MEQELNGPWPLHGHDAALPPMAGWWMAWANDGSALSHDSAMMLWWSGSEWTDSRGFHYPHVGHWAGKSEMWPLDYDYALCVKDLVIPNSQRRARIDGATCRRLLGEPEQTSLPFIAVPSRTKITYIPKV